MVKWHTGDGLRYFVEAAVEDLGLSARHVKAVGDWMVNFQQRPVQGGVVLAEETIGTTHGVGACMPSSKRAWRTRSSCRKFKCSFFRSVHTRSVANCASTLGRWTVTPRLPSDAGALCATLCTTWFTRRA
jgi:hypothetical protein